jgi:predicted metal-dependent enzyme (double-stranded beta helix superfamily)
LLQALLADLQRNDAAYQSSRAQYLEATDEQGNTPVTLAAARGHLQCVQVVRALGQVCRRHAHFCDGVGSSQPCWHALQQMHRPGILCWVLQRWPAP